MAGVFRKVVSAFTRPRGRSAPAVLLPKEERHLPGRAEITHYGNGGFRFAEMSHRGAILCLPSGVFALEAVSAADLNIETLSRALAAFEGIETFLIGTGKNLVPLDEATRAAFRDCNIVVECVATGTAVRMYNIMLGENRAVACALLAVE